MNTPIREVIVSLGSRKHVLRPISIVFPNPGGITRGPDAYEGVCGGMKMQLELIGNTWCASIRWGNSWHVSREGVSPQAAFDLCEWELARIYRELRECLLCDDMAKSTPT